MKVCLQVNGQEMIFSEQELTAIVEKHFSAKTTQKTHEDDEISTDIEKYYEGYPDDYWGTDQ